MIFIKKIKITNFKSFKRAGVALGDFNVLIGANAAGKSNFVEIFKFVRDILNYGLDNAISMQGGIEYLRNIKSGYSKPLSFEIDYGISNFTEEKTGNAVKKLEKINYKFTLSFGKNDFFITKDKLEMRFNFRTIRDKNKNRLEKGFKVGKIILEKKGKKINFNLDPPKETKDLFDIDIKKFLKLRKFSSTSLLLEELSFLFLLLFYPRIEGPLRDISVYNFDPKLSKKATLITGKKDLEENGSNLAIVLRDILKNEKTKNRFFNFVKTLLPFIKGVDIEKFADKSLMLKFKETYTGKKYLPASLISDGTINMIALIVALYFEGKPIVIIEEPEENIHPSLASRVVDILQDASKKKQIIITTHNPQVVRHASLKDIIFISRNKDGFSEISRLNDKENLKIFLKNRITKEDLFIQNLYDAL